MLINKTKNTIIAEKTKILKNPFSQSIGLMFSKKIKNKALIFKFTKPRIVYVHMFFVFFPIDILFLDENQQIIETLTNLKPFSFYKSKNKAKYLIELPLNQIRDKKINLLDKLEF